MRIHLSPSDWRGFEFLGSRSFRAHYPHVAELLEEWYHRRAETCDLFVNVSEADKYCVTCTVCHHFESGHSDCANPLGPSIVKKTMTAEPPALP